MPTTDKEPSKYALPLDPKIRNLLERQAEKDGTTPTELIKHYYITMLNIHNQIGHLQPPNQTTEFWFLTTLYQAVQDYKRNANPSDTPT